MLPIIHENTQMNYTEKDSLKVMMKDYELLIKMTTHFMNTYYKMMKKSDDKEKYAKLNTTLIIRAINTCIYKFMQKHDDCVMYFKKVGHMNNIMLNKSNDRIKMKYMTKILNIKC